MLSPIAKPCMVCGARVLDGSSRCPRHKGQAYRLPVSCKVCGKRGKTSFCDEHKPAPYASVDERPQGERVAAQPWRKGYRDPDYHRHRQAAITRAGGRCEGCGGAVVKGGFEVDHIVPLSTARSVAEIKALNHRSNLQVLCLGCHRRKRKTRRQP